MDYIVNPSWFYWASVFSGLKIFTLVTGAVSIFASPIVYFVCNDEYDWRDDCEDIMRKVKKICVTAVIIGFLFLIIGIFIPNEETMIRMMLARLATGENVEAVLQRITEMAKEIISAGK